MSTSERDRVHNIMKNMACGNNAGQQLVWDPRTKKVKATSYSDPDRSTLEITHQTWNTSV